MPVVKINLGEAQGVAGPGTWLCEVENYSTEKKTRGGDVMHVVRSRIVEPEEYKGKAHFENLVQTEESVWTTDRLLKACGVEVPDDKSERENFEFDTDELVGRQFVVILEAQQDNPQYTNTVALLTVEQAEAQDLDYGPEVVE